MTAWAVVVGLALALWAGRWFVGRLAARAAARAELRRLTVKHWVPEPAERAEERRREVAAADWALRTADGREAP